MSMTHADSSENTEKNGATPKLFKSMKVLVVDDKKDLLDSVARLLCSYSFEVTCARHPGEALRLLFDEENKFDLLLIDKDMTDVDVHTFLRLTKNLDLLSMVMSEEDDDATLLKAFKNGASHVLKRPLTIGDVTLMRQHIVRARIQKHRNCENKNMICKRKDGNDPMNGVYQTSEEEQDDDDGIKRRISMTWTQELHEKFLSATTQLGEGRCYPKEILKLMDVPGLTKLQVASHLQKCRNGKWKANEKIGTLSPQTVNEARFGSMPYFQIDQNIDLSLSLGGYQSMDDEAFKMNIPPNGRN